MVTFGIKPTHPETGYGYLELVTDPLDNIGSSELKNFIEKPNPQAALQMFEAGHYLERRNLIPCSGHA